MYMFFLHSRVDITQIWPECCRTTRKMTIQTPGNDRVNREMIDKSVKINKTDNKREQSKDAVTIKKGQKNILGKRQ